MLKSFLVFLNLRPLGETFVTIVFETVACMRLNSRVGRECKLTHLLVMSVVKQPRLQGLLAFQYGGGRREDSGSQRTKTISGWYIPWCIHTCALTGLLFPKQSRWPFEVLVETEKCFLLCFRFRSCIFIK